MTIRNAEPQVAEPWAAVTTACEGITPPAAEQMDTAAAELKAWTAEKWPRCTDAARYGRPRMRTTDHRSLTRWPRRVAPVREDDDVSVVSTSAQDRYSSALDWVRLETVPRHDGGEAASADQLAEFAEAVLSNFASEPRDCPYCRADGFNCPACGAGFADDRPLRALEQA